MKVLLLAIYLIISFQLPATAMSDCDTNFPSQGEVLLSNGYLLNLPSRSTDFDLVTVIGLADLGPLKKLLSPLGLHPLKLNNQGVILVSFYDYKKSDMGSFREFYIVAMATRKETSPLQGIWQILNSIRVGPYSPHENIVFHHLMAAGNEAIGRIASYQIWGIPNFKAQLDFNFGENLSAEVSLLPLINSGEIKIQLKNNLILNPLGLNYHMYASGFNGIKLVRSPVMACGATFGNSWSEQDHLESTGTINTLLKFLKFRPIRKEVGHQLKAVQFAPVAN